MRANSLLLFASTVFFFLLKLWLLLNRIYFWTFDEPNLIRIFSVFSPKRGTNCNNARSEFYHHKWLHTADGQRHDCWSKTQNSFITESIAFQMGKAKKSEIRKSLVVWIHGGWIANCCMVLWPSWTIVSECQKNGPFSWLRCWLLHHMIFPFVKGRQGTLQVCKLEDVCTWNYLLPQKPIDLSNPLNDMV